MANLKKSPTPMKSFGTKIVILVKTNHKLLFFFLCLSVFNVILLCCDFSSKNLGFGKKFIFALIGSLLLEIFLCVILYFAKKHQWKIEKIFLIFGITIGSIFTLAMPLGRAPDEASHFLRIYEILEGHMTSDYNAEKDLLGSEEPGDIMAVERFSVNHNGLTYKNIIEHLGDHADGEVIFVDNTAYGYSPISYTPQIIGMGIGKILNLPFIISAYFARFTNMFFCIIILYFCIKKTPILKEIVFLLALLPVSLQSICSLSADGLIFISAIALICFVLYSIYSRKTPFTKKHFFAITALCLFLTMGKIVYAPLCFILFCIPKERFGSTRKKLFWIFGIGAITITTYLIWYFIAPPVRSITEPGTQISFILHNPLKYFAVVVHTITANIYDTLFFFSGAFGGYLEWYNVTPTLVYIIALYTVFVLLCARARQSVQIPKNLKVLAAILFPTIILAIYTAMFVTWTKVGESRIDGVQGRYFLPILFLIPICFLPIKKAKSQKTSPSFPQNYYLYAFIIFECVYTISTIVCAHL